MYLTRACLAASALLCFTLHPAAAQYNIFNSEDGPFTDVIINGRPEALASVQQFEARCRTHAAAGRFWLDLQNGNSGAEGGPATYNVITCQSLTSPVGSPDQPHGMTCNSHRGGYYCIDPHDITLTPSRR
jgi:hypothetical protein